MPSSNDSRVYLHVVCPLQKIRFCSVIEEPLRLFVCNIHGSSSQVVRYLLGLRSWVGGERLKSANLLETYTRSKTRVGLLKGLRSWVGGERLRDANRCETGVRSKTRVGLLEGLRSWVCGE